MTILDCTTQLETLERTEVFIIVYTSAVLIPSTALHRPPAPRLGAGDGTCSGHPSASLSPRREERCARQRGRAHRRRGRPEPAQGLRPPAGTPLCGAAPPCAAEEEEGRGGGGERKKGLRLRGSVECVPACVWAPISSSPPPPPPPPPLLTSISALLPPLPLPLAPPPRTSRRVSAHRGSSRALVLRQNRGGPALEARQQREQPLLERGVEQLRARLLEQHLSSHSFGVD